MKQSFYKRHPEAYSILVVIVITFIVLAINTAAWLITGYVVENFSKRTNDIIIILSSFIGAISFISPFIFLHERAMR
jgi:hypothetical protein